MARDGAVSYAASALTDYAHNALIQSCITVLQKTAYNVSLMFTEGYLSDTYLLANAKLGF